MLYDICTGNIGPQIHLRVHVLSQDIYIALLLTLRLHEFVRITEAVLHSYLKTYIFLILRKGTYQIHFSLHQTIIMLTHVIRSPHRMIHTMGMMIQTS